MILPLLGAVPDSAIIIVSGLGEKKEAQEKLSVGMGYISLCFNLVFHTHFSLIFVLLYLVLGEQLVFWRTHRQMMNASRKIDGSRYTSVLRCSAHSQFTQ